MKKQDKKKKKNNFILNDFLKKDPLIEFKK